MAAEPYRWVPSHGGSIPLGAVAQGHEADGRPLHVARANFSNTLCPGKVRAEFGGIHIPYGGREITVVDYEVLMEPGVWARANDGGLPPNAIVCGHEAGDVNNAPLYVIRASWNGGIHPGKLRPGFRAGHIPYGGEEIEVSEYEVLVLP